VKFAFNKVLRRGSLPLLGIDVTASSVKLVELAPGPGSTMRLEGYAIEPIEHGAIVDGNVEKPKAVADALLRAIRRAKTGTKRAALAVPSSSVIAKRLALPPGLSEMDYEFQVESEASQYIPFPIEEVNLDFQVMPSGQDASADVDVLLVASRKDKVEDRLAIAEMAGLQAVVVDVEPYAARSAIHHVAGFLSSQGDKQILAFFDVGQSSTNLTIILDGETIFERDQMFGGGQLTQGIVRLYGLTVEEAEQKKRSGDLPENYGPQLLEPFVAQGATELSRALQFFFTSTPYSSVDRIYLAGGCAIMPGFAEAVAEKTKVPTEVMNPFQGLEVSSKIRSKQLRLDAPALMVACGLAMRRFDE